MLYFDVIFQVKMIGSIIGHPLQSEIMFSISPQKVNRSGFILPNASDLPLGPLRRCSKFETLYPVINPVLQYKLLKNVPNLVFPAVTFTKEELIFLAQAFTEKEHPELIFRHVKNFVEHFLTRYEKLYEADRESDPLKIPFAGISPQIRIKLEENARVLVEAFRIGATAVFDPKLIQEWKL